MTPEISRSEFLQGRISGRHRPLRPPWARPEPSFLDLCNGCGDCMVKCPTGIIRRGRGNYPRVDFERGECLFCGDCASACKTGALDRKLQLVAWSMVAEIDEQRCLAFKAIECRSCSDPCEQRAIRFDYRVGAVAIPRVDAQACNGCGACYAPCPVDAIQINPVMETAA